MQEHHTEKKSALILEGGANRGIFTAGVLDYLMEQNLKTDYVIGVSAGACNAVDYASWQPYRSRDCIIAWNQENRRDRLKSFHEERNVIDLRMLFDVFPNNEFPFDFDTFFHSSIDCEITVTNCLNGKAEYKRETGDRKRLMQICKASCSLPLLTQMVRVDGIPYFDGGLADSIPVIRARKLGYQKNIIVLTQKRGYRKTVSKKTIGVIRAALRHYPELVRTFCLRPYVYNKCLDSIEKWEDAGALYVIRPEIEPVHRLENNVGKLEGFYQHGYDVMKKQFDGMMDYLNK